MSENRPEPGKVSEYTAINMLQYGLTMATLKKTNFKFKVDIPYEELASSCGISEYDAMEFIGSALRISVNMKWVEDSGEMEYSYE
jgi:hypothetical protein